jgi:hypothetical protein
MTLEPSIINAALAIFGSVASVAGLGWWLATQFRRVESAQRKILDAHEDKDQERHEENLGRFAEIKVALARLGYRNGGAPL